MKGHSAAKTAMNPTENIMKKLLYIPVAAALLAGPAMAERTKTVTVENDRISGSKTITRDGNGNVSVDGDLTRKSDGLPVGAVSGFCNMLWKLPSKPVFLPSPWI